MKRFLLSLLSSLLLFMATPGSWQISQVAWFALVPLLFALRNSHPRKAFWNGFAFGLAYFILSIYWIVIVLGRYAGLPLWVSIPALVALCAYMALYPGLFALYAQMVSGPMLRVILLPAAWVGLDYLRGFLFTGFPWQDIGYSQFKHIRLIQAADLFGHHGITFLIVAVNVTLCSLLPMLFQRRNNPAEIPASKAGKVFGASVLCLIMVMLFMLYGAGRQKDITTQMAAGTQADIAVVQANVDQSQKWRPELKSRTIDAYLRLTEEAVHGKKQVLVVWPETAMPFFPAGHPLFETVKQTVAARDLLLITGAPHYERDQTTGGIEYFNSAFILQADDDENQRPLPRYDKRHLVPFGEYVPLGRFLPHTLPIVQTMGNFSAGKATGPFPVGNDIMAGLLICYESIFPDLARQSAAAGANLLVNLTNDAWYGRSSAPWQQLSMVVFRSVENRRSMARAANTGVSCLVDPAGRIVESTPLFEEAQRSARLPLFTTGTFFQKAGYLFPLNCLILLCFHLFYVKVGLSKNEPAVHIQHP